MATVPIPRQQVDPRAIATVFNSGRAGTPEAFGAAEARATQGLGSTITEVAGAAANIIMDRQRQLNGEEFDRMKVEFRRRQRELARGTGEAGSRGWRDRLEGEAIETDGETRDLSRTMRRELTSGGSNRRVRQMFSLWSGAEEENEFSAMDDHIADQRVSSQNRSARANITELGIAMADDPLSEARNQKRRAQIVIQTENMLDLNGVVDPVARGDVIRQELSKAHEAVINRLLVENPGAAQAYFDAHEGEITALTKTQILEDLKTGVQKETALTLAEEIYSPEKTRAEMNKEAREKAPNAETAQDVIRDLTLRRETHLADKREAREAVDQAAAEHLATAGPYVELPPQLLNQMDAKQREDYETLRVHTASRRPPTPDYEYFEDALRLRGEEAADISLLEAEARLGRNSPQFSAVQRHKEAALTSNSDDRNPGTPTQMFNAHADGIGLNGTDKKDDRGRFRSMFVERLQEAEQRENRRLTVRETQDLLNELSEPIVTDPGISVFGHRIFREEKTPFQVRVPAEKRRQILEAFANAGEPRPSQFEIARIHLTGEGLPEQQTAPLPSDAPDPSGPSAELRQRFTQAFVEARGTQPTEADIRFMWQGFLDAQRSE